MKQEDRGLILNELNDILNKITLPYCNDVLIGDALHYPSRDFGQVSFLHLVLRFIRILLTTSISHYHNHKISDNGELFIFTSAGRKDGLVKFERLFNLIQKGSCIEYSFNKSYINLSKFSQIPKIFNWYGKLLAASIKKSLSFEIALCLYECYIEVYEIEKTLSALDIKFYRATFFCDVMPVDSFLVQKFKKKGIRTVSLQHGMASASFDKYIFLYSHSDDYLAGNFFTINEAKSVGRGENMIPAGLIGSIGNPKKQIERKRFDVKTIGLLLDSSESHELNIEFAKFVNEYCSRYGYDLYVKLHPTEERFKEKYKYLFSENNCKGIWAKDISLGGFSEKIDLAVVRYSTCLIEMLELGVPAFSFYSRSSNRDMYINCGLDIRFSDDTTLTRLIDKVNSMDYYKEFIQCRNFFYIDNAEENYIKYYN